MSIRTRMGDCGECKWYKAKPELMKSCAPYHFDGICLNKRHAPSEGYKVYSRAACCFDAEDPDGQMTLEEVLV